MGVRRLGIWIRRCLLAGALIWSITFLALVVHISYARTPPSLAAPADAIICLGAGMSLTEGWMIPDIASNRRAVTCAMLYQEGVAPVIIFTGYGHHVSSVAAAMGRVALDHGVPERAIILEETAQSTIQNAAFSLPLLPDDATRIVIVSDRFHLPRARLIFRAFTDIEVATFAADPRIVGLDTSGKTMLQWTAREALAIWSNAVRAGAYGLAGVIGIDRETRIGWMN